MKKFIVYIKGDMEIKAKDEEEALRKAYRELDKIDLIYKAEVISD